MNLQTTYPPQFSDRILESVRGLYEQGKYVQAYRASAGLGPLGSWPGVEGRILAGRLAGNLGRRQWSSTLLRLAGREHPMDPRAVYYATSAYIESHGPLLGWKKLQEMRFPSERADADTMASWLGMHATTLASLRDFERAHRWLDHAAETSSQDPWVLTLQSAISHMEDRRDIAWNWVERALEVRPWFRPAVDQKMSLLLDRGDRSSALDWLNEALTHIESLRMLGAKIRMLMDEGRYQDAWSCLQDMTQMDVLGCLTGRGESWLNSLRCDLACHLGQWSQAAEYARAIPKSDYYKEFAERLDRAAAAPVPELPTRIQLQVPFVRQHHRTCAPATLAGLTAYFGKGVEHEEIANRICYDGTAAHDERQWAEQNGFRAREFRVTLEVAEQLIRAGLPFALATTGVEMGHLQTVVGFDSIRGVLLIQDPSSPWVEEAAANAFLEYYASSGPRGMVMVPEDQQHRLQGIDLPEAGLYDLQYQVDLALDQHQRAEAQSIIDQMIQLDEQHRLTLQSMASLARYDGNDALKLKHLDALQALYPNDLRLLLHRFSSMGDQSNRPQRIAELRRLYQEKGPHPFIASRLAEELMDDARDFGEAAQILRRSARYAGPSSAMAASISRLSWNEGHRDAYLDFARLSACIEDRNESRLRSYFQAACFLHQEDQAMRWLEERTKSIPSHGDPFMTLSWAYEQIQKPSEALRVLEEALVLLPEDGILHAYAAHKLSAYGKTERAKQLLEFARNKCPVAMYHRTAAAIDLDAGHLRSAQKHLNAVLEIDPLDMGTMDRLLQVDHDLDGATAARQRLDAALSKFPNSYALRAAAVSWIRQNEPIGADEAIDSMLKDFPQDPWAMREAALVKMQRHDWSAAAEFARQAIDFEPKYSRNWALLGRCQQELGDFAQAKVSYRESLRCSVDDPYPMRPLLDLCATPEERREVLDFIYSELANQTTYGDGVSGFYELAVGRMPYVELVAKLEMARGERADLPQTWSCLVDIYCRLHRLDEAIQTATQATDLFPLHVGAWIDLAAAQRTAGDFDASLATLEHAQTIGVTNPQIAKQLSELYRSRKQWDKADEVLVRALESNPRDAVLIAFRAETLWDLGKHDQAIETMERAVVMLPNYDWAWNTLSIWCRERQQWQVLKRASQAMIDARPHQVRGYLRAADAAIEESDFSESLRWIEKALAIDPRCVDAHHLKAWALSLAGQHQAALEATRPEALRDAPSPPLLLTRSELLFSQGDSAAAIQARKEAVALDPDNYNGWRRLMAWTDQGTDAALHEESARNCIRLAPNNVDGYGYLSGALIAKGDKVEAKQWLAEAIMREPGYEYAVQTLFDLQIKDGELDAAKRIRDQSLDQVSPELSKSMSIRLLLEENQLDEAFEQLCEVAAGPVRMWGILYLTVDAWKTQEDLCRRCAERMAAGNASEALGRIWARSRIAAKPKVSLIKDLKRVPESEAWYGAVDYLLNQEGPLLLSQWTLFRMRFAFRKRLLKHAAVWSAMARAMNHHKMFQQTVQWCRQWRRVPDIQHPAQWYPAVLAAWLTEQSKVAQPWIQAALELPDDDHASVMRLWGALDAMRRNSPAEAAKWLARVDLTNVNEWFIDLYRWVAWYVHEYAMQTDPKERSKLRRQLRRRSIPGVDMSKMPWLRTTLGRHLAWSDGSLWDWIQA